MINCHSISDFNENLVDEFRGVMIEALGYDEWDQYGQHYGEKKDNSALALLDAHFAQIYVAREQARDGDLESLHTWYRKNAKCIGVNAPLLTETQYKQLMELVMKNPSVPFEELLLNLATNYVSHGFKTKTDAEAFQLLFGIVEGLEGYRITENMEQWWTNYRNSNQGMIDGDFNLHSSQLHYYWKK